MDSDSIFESLEDFDWKLVGEIAVGYTLGIVAISVLKGALNAFLDV